jgi:3-oxoadipate enol-lactonase
VIEPLLLSEIRQVGTGPAVVLIHPLGANVDYWVEIERHVTARTLISYNLPGHGGRSTATKGYRIEDLADDLAAVLDALGLDSASIVGVSIGGLVGQAFAANYPERTQSLILVDCVPAYPPDFATGLTKRAEVARQEGLAGLVRPTLELWFTAETAATDSELTELVERMLLSADPEGYAHACEALVAADLRPLAADIQTFTSVLYGEFEVPAFVIGSEWLASNIPGASLEVIAGGKHAASLECASAFSEILDRLLPR